MAATQIVLGLVLEGAADRKSVVRRYEELFPNKAFVEALGDPLPLKRDKEGKLQASAPDVVGTAESKVDAALVSLRERGLIQATAAGSGASAHEESDSVYVVTTAGRAHFEWWRRDASALDPHGNEFWEKVLLSEERHAERLIELAERQERVCLARLEELRCSGERSAFAGCSTLGELWLTAMADREPGQLQVTVESVRTVRSEISTFVAKVDEAVDGLRRAME